MTCTREPKPLRGIYWMSLSIHLSFFLNRFFLSFLHLYIEIFEISIWRIQQWSFFCDQHLLCFLLFHLFLLTLRRIALTFHICLVYFSLLFLIYHKLLWTYAWGLGFQRFEPVSVLELSQSFLLGLTHPPIESPHLKLELRLLFRCLWKSHVFQVRFVFMPPNFRYVYLRSENLNYDWRLWGKVPKCLALEKLLLLNHSLLFLF